MSDELPLTFLFTLSSDKSAMQNFAAMSAEERARIQARVLAARSKEEMRVIVNSLSDRHESYETY